MVRLIDSTPIPLGKLCEWAKSNGRIRGMKMHVVYDPKADCPRVLDITDANVNDAQIGRTIAIETGATYVFDKGYCHYGWWRAIHDAQSFFVTRPKTSMKLKLVTDRPVMKSQGDGFTVLEDSEVSFASKGNSKLPMRLRRVRVERHEGGATIVLLTNDFERSAVEIGALYKARWQIELLFRWIKQHLKIRKFLGNNDNAIRLQLLAAMIAYRTPAHRCPHLRRHHADPSASTTSWRNSSSSGETSPPSTSRHPSTQASDAIEPSPIRWHSPMSEFSPDSPARKREGERSETHRSDSLPNTSRLGPMRPRARRRQARMGERC